MTCAETTHPLDKVIAQFAGLNRAPPDLPASFGRPIGSGWYLASDLLAEEGTLKELLGLFGKYMKTERPFLQAALFMPYYTHLFVPAVV